MNEFLRKLIEGNGTSPSDICLQSLSENFENAVNVEWVNRNEYYEATFYLNNQEFIARFNHEGTLMEYSQNLPFEFLPEVIKEHGTNKGELMNALMKNKGNTIEYELIIRDKNLKRYLLLFSNLGELIEERTL